MWTLWTLLGCTPGADGEPGGADEAGAPALVFQPVAVDFGEVALGTSEQQSLTIRNAGTSDVLVGELSTSPDSLVSTGTHPTEIGAGDEVALTLEWTPVDAGRLDGSLALRAGTHLDALSDFQVPVGGSATGARLAISAETFDLGEVSLGCSGRAQLVLTNIGTETLVITALALSNDVEFALENDAGSDPAVPIHVRPELPFPIAVVYTPTTEDSASTTLEIESNDALAPTTSVSVEGQGRIAKSNTMSWTIDEPQAVTAIINVNVWAITYAFLDNLYDFLPALFEALRAAGAPYRVAFVVAQDGSVDGELPYIDDSFTVDEATDAAQAMLEGPSIHGDNDYGLQTCLVAIEENADWLLDESEPWIDARLNLVVVNSDTDQSPKDATYYIDEYDDYRDLDDLAVHAIAGDVPAGCVGHGGGAFPSPNVDEAAEATDGVYLSICADDWTKSAPTLVDAFMGGRQTFVLEGHPAPGSIEVHIDGAQVFDGWSYDEASNEIVFDATSYPAVGAELRVDYLMAVTCD